MILLGLLLLSTSTGVESAADLDSLPRKHPLAASLGEEKAAVAKLIETTLVESGLSPRLARAAAINAYAESLLEPTAVGDGGNSVGVFQLHARGLGHDMSVESRKDIKVSSLKVAAHVLKDKKLIKMQAACASMEEMIKAFTVRVMRPKNMLAKAAQRAALGKRLMLGVIDECVPAQL